MFEKKKKNSVIDEMRSYYKEQFKKERVGRLRKAVEPLAPPFVLLPLAPFI